MSTSCHWGISLVAVEEEKEEEQDCLVEMAPRGCDLVVMIVSKFMSN